MGLTLLVWAFAAWWAAGPGGASASPPHLGYIVQPGTPAGIPNFIQPEAGCAWAGVGGQVFAADGAPASGLALKLSGSYGGQTLLKVAVSGSSPAFGPGGFEFYLGSQPQATRSLALQVLGPGGAPLSAPIQLGTLGDCQHNLLVVNLKALTYQRVVYFPLARK